MSDECKPPARTVVPAYEDKKGGQVIGSSTVKSPDGTVTVTLNTAGAYSIQSGQNPPVILGVDGARIMTRNPNTGEFINFESKEIGKHIRGAADLAFECGDFSPAKLFGDEMPKTTMPKSEKREDPLLKPKGRA